MLKQRDFLVKALIRSFSIIEIFLCFLLQINHFILHKFH